MARKRFRTWPWNAALEAAIREDPDDDARWSVLEDWILQHEDERAQMILATKAGDDDAATKARWALSADLLESKGLDLALAGSAWRAGYLDRMHFEAPAHAREARLRELLASRAASLARSLRIVIDQPEELARLPVLLEAARCKESLRRLSIAAYWKPTAQPAAFDAGSIARLRLDELQFSDRAIRVAYAPPLAALRRLGVVPGALADLADLLQHGGFPALRRLDLDLRILEARGGAPLDVLGGLFDREPAPQLETLHVRASDALFAAILDRLAASPLAAQLASVERDHAQLWKDRLPERLLPALGHLARD